MNLKNSSKVRFEVRNHVLWNKSVLGKTDPLDVQELLLKQREIGEERDSCACYLTDHSTFFLVNSDNL